MSQIFYQILEQPLLNLLTILYAWVPPHDLGIAILLLTLVINLVFLPSTVRQFRTQQKMAELKPHLDRIQAEHGQDKAKAAQAQMALFREHKVNPFGSCLGLILQFAVFIVLWRVLLRSVEAGAGIDGLYSFVPNPGSFNPTFLGFLPLTQPSLWLALVVGVLQYFQMRRTPQMSSSGIQQKMFLYFFPAFSVIVLLKIPAWAGLYWAANALFAWLRQEYILRTSPPTPSILPAPPPAA